MDMMSSHHLFLQIKLLFVKHACLLEHKLFCATIIHICMHKIFELVYHITKCAIIGASSITINTKTVSIIYKIYQYVLITHQPAADVNVYDEVLMEEVFV